VVSAAAIFPSVKTAATHLARRYIGARKNHFLIRKISAQQKYFAVNRLTKVA
jgi:hypothetical protein